jgi:hypothetical protein
MTTLKTVIYVLTSNPILKFKIVSYSFTPISFTYLSFKAYHIYRCMSSQDGDFFFFLHISLWNSLCSQKLALYRPEKMWRSCNNSISSQQACKVCLTYSSAFIMWTLFHLGRTSSGSWVTNLLQGKPFVYFICHQSCKERDFQKIVLLLQGL